MKSFCKRKKFPVLVGICVIVLIFLIFDGNCHAVSTGDNSDGTQQDLLEEQARSSGIDKIKDELEKYADEESRELLQDYDPAEIISDAYAGKLDLNLKNLLNNALKFLFREIYQNLGILAKLAILAVICALLKNLQASFLSEGTSEIAFYVCYVVIVSILLVSFGTAIELGTGIIDEMVSFMIATVPVLITLLVSGGNLTTGGVFQPIMLMAVEFTANIIKSVFIPMIFLSTILSIINNISEKVQLNRLAGFIKQITTWGLGIILTLFISVISLQGSLGAVVDGVTSKTAKFAISTFIPVVGKTLSDAADTVIGCTLLIKNAAGIAAMIGVIIICAIPLIKILALAALYKCAGALLEPISEKRVTNCINDVAGSMIYVFAVTVSVAFMFLISVTALISAGNVSAMIR